FQTFALPISITRIGSTSSSLTVRYSLNGSASNGSDYKTLGSSVTIASGSISAILTVTPIDDSTVEGSETVVLTIASDPAYTVGSPSSATVTIADNDQEPPPLPTVTVTASDPHASESGDTGASTITRTGSTSSSLPVYITINGYASPRSDYQMASFNSVTIPAGSSSATATVRPIDDS